MIYNPAKHGMCINQAIEISKTYTNYDRLGKDKEAFKKLIRELYLFATESEEDIKDYEPEKRKLEYE